MSAEGLLQVWEEQQRAHPVARALALLALTRPVPGWHGWLHASIGARDAALLALHGQLFGSALHTATACPACGERLESSVDLCDLGAAEDSDSPFSNPVLRLEAQGCTLDYRLLNSADLLALAGRALAPEAAAAQLLRRCVSGARRGEVELDVAALPESVVACLDAAMAQHDAAADLQIALTCPVCEARWTTHVDIVTTLWDELDDWARRMLAEVHALARVYGWAEAAILALSPARRRAYLDLVGA